MARSSVFAIALFLSGGVGFAAAAPDTEWLRRAKGSLAHFEYRFSPSKDGGWTAPNRSHDLRTSLGAAPGVEVTSRTRGGDWSVSSANPLEELEVAVTRIGPQGETKEPFIPEERIDLPAALAAFTINAAYVNFQDDRTGSLEPGKLADLVVLDRNLFTIKPETISDAKVILTLLGGQPVHGDFSLGLGNQGSLGANAPARV